MKRNKNILKEHTFYNCDACMAYMRKDEIEVTPEDMDILKKLKSIKNPQMKESCAKLIESLSSEEK